MGFIVDTEPRDPEWIKREIEKNLRKAIGDELYDWLGEQNEETRKEIKSYTGRTR